MAAKNHARGLGSWRTWRRECTLKRGLTPPRPIPSWGPKFDGANQGRTRDGLEPPGGSTAARPGPAVMHWPRHVIIAVGSWYLLKELAPLLRPLVLAVFLAYTIQPAHHALRQRVDAKFAGPLLALFMAMALLGLALLVYTNLVDLKAELPHLVERARGLTEQLRTWGHEHLPAWAFDPVPGHDPRRGGDDRTTQDPGVLPGQHRSRLPRRGHGCRVLPDLPAP